MMLFPILLFSSTEGDEQMATRITQHELSFMHLLERYFLQHFNGSHELAAKRLGIANEIIFFIKHH